MVALLYCFLTLFSVMVQLHRVSQTGEITGKTIMHSPMKLPANGTCRYRETLTHEMSIGARTHTIGVRRMVRTGQPMPLSLLNKLVCMIILTRSTQTRAATTHITNVVSPSHGCWSRGANLCFDNIYRKADFLFQLGSKTLSTSQTMV